MTERIQRLTEQTMRGERYFSSKSSKQVEYDREDIFLSPLTMAAKRCAEYILAQEPQIEDDTSLPGCLKFRGDVMGDNFFKAGHKNYDQINALFYNKPVDHTVTFEFQHSVADYQKVLRIGIDGIRAEIAASKQAHTEEDRLEFLCALDTVAEAMIGWAEKCSRVAAQRAALAAGEVKERLEALSRACQNVPRRPAESFYEALLTICFVYAFVPDSIGVVDRYLYPYYKRDIERGVLTDEKAVEYLQELFLQLQAKTKITSDRFFRGGESHFAVGGYLPNGEDGFNELSRLIVEGLMELPTYTPQISLRWTRKTPREVLRYMMDMERKDKNKRIAFVNDEPRLRALYEVGGFSREVACDYTMVGCNEVQLPGGIFMGGCDANVLKSVEMTLQGREQDVLRAPDFEAFYAIFEEELTRLLDRVRGYYDKFQSVRARDNNFVSALFYEGVIERAKSMTRGGAKNALAAIGLMGITNVIDSLTVIKQHVFEEKRYTMRELLDALRANWKGFEDMRHVILKTTAFFGNDAEISSDLARRFSDSVEAYFADKRSALGYPFLTGNLTGYNQHFKWFGEGTCATPDGRYAGEPMSFGIGQGEGKDREGLSALLASVAKLTGSSNILCGSTVTNVLLDEQLVKNDAHFEKTVQMMEAYLQAGGLHFQLNYVSREDLLAARVTPEKYSNLRVRVSGFSDYFVILNEDLQDEIVKRTEHQH